MASSYSQIKCTLLYKEFRKNSQFTARLVVMCPSLIGTTVGLVSVHTPVSLISFLWWVWTLLSPSVCICNEIFEKHTKMAFRNLSLDLTKTFLRQTFWLKWKKEANKALFMIGMNKTLLSKSMQSHVILGGLVLPLTFCLNYFERRVQQATPPYLSDIFICHYKIVQLWSNNSAK